MFRKRALEQLQSPEQLDQLLQVVSRRSWIPLATVGFGLVLALAWSIFGQIPISVEGNGILVYPRQVVSFQAPASGQLVALEVQVGSLVEKGDVMGRINQPELAQRLDQERVRLAEIRARNDEMTSLRTRRADLQIEAIERKRRLLEARIESSTRMAEAQKSKNERYITNQRQKIERLKGASQALGVALNQRLESYQQLRREGLSSDDALLQARQSFIDNQVRAAELELQIQEIELKQIDAENKYLERMDAVADLRFQLQELDIRLAEIKQQQVESSSDSALEIQELERNIARLEEELKTKGQVVSEYSGRILEVTGAAGQYVVAGQRLGAIEAENPAGQLVAAAYFDVADGKKINPDMHVRVTPATVSRERYGSIRAVVEGVSRFPVTTDAVTNVVGNAEVARMLTGGGGKIEVFSNLARNPDTPTGFQWTSGEGPRTSITAGTTVQARVTVEYRRPITFAIPILRHWSGID